MKRALFPFLLLPMLAYGQAKSGDELLSSGLKKYSFERLKITYQLSGDAEGGEMMVFKDFGWKSVRKQTMIFELYGIKTIQTLYEITDGDYVYRLNEGDSTMISRKDYRWSQQAAYKKPLDASEAILFSIGGTYQADTTLLGRTCEIWTFENKALQELWIWNGLVLRRKTKLGDQTVYATASEILTDFEPENSWFEVPDYMKEKE